MEYWQAFILGIVQGLTEFLPISSTAHLKVVPAIFGWQDSGISFDAVIQLGSIAAVVGYFWKDLSNITLGSIKAVRSQNYNSQEFKLAVAIALGTIPILLVGLLIKIFVPDYDKSPFAEFDSDRDRLNCDVEFTGSRGNLGTTPNQRKASFSKSTGN